jgi:hypothetical protein
VSSSMNRGLNINKYVPRYFIKIAKLNFRRLGEYDVLAKLSFDYLTNICNYKNCCCFP